MILSHSSTRYDCTEFPPNLIQLVEILSFENVRSELNLEFSSHRGIIM